ncbi:MAG TPA: radical SAM protein [Oligoflexia bacterium]|nr:radical SAM protein [Oligoflexia bacterium]HMR23768.1 radical SAM protein [Oligoflexia bacterium]
MSDVLVINQPFVKDFCRTQRWAAKTRGRVLRAPDWLAYATAVLEKENVDVKLYDFPAREWGRKEFRELIAAEQPQYVVLDSTTPSIESDIGCARDVKEMAPHAKVIMVGPHASSCSDETLKNANGAVDAIAVGEYDYTVRDLITRDPHWKEVQGAVLWNGGDIIKNEARPLIEPIDELPYPAWHQLDLLKYFDGTKLHPYVDIFSGRGCPHKCTFCLWPQVMHGHKLRLRDPKCVVDEMEWVISICPEVVQGGEFFFEDDTFTLHKPTALGICEEILSRGLKVTFSVNARVDTADLHMMEMLKKAGCRELLVGFESGNQQVLDNIKKRATVEQAKVFMDRTKQAGLDVHGTFVMGLPGETKESMKETVEFANGLGLHTLQFSAAMPFPGTKYFEYAEEKGYLNTKDWSKWLDPEGEQTGVVSYPGLSKDEVEAGVNEGLKRFYFRPSYILRFALKNMHFKDFLRKVRGFRHFAGYLIENNRWVKKLFKKSSNKTV